MHERVGANVMGIEKDKCHCVLAIGGCASRNGRLKKATPPRDDTQASPSWHSILYGIGQSGRYAGYTFVNASILIPVPTNVLSVKSDADVGITA